MFLEGTTYFVASDPHLWVIISNPVAFPDDVLQVNLTSYDPRGRPNDARNDPACILDRSDGYHFVTHATCVYYAGAQKTSVNHLRHRYETGSLRLHDQIGAKILEKIRIGATTSEHILPIHCDLLIEQGLA